MACACVAIVVVPLARAQTPFVTWIHESTWPYGDGVAAVAADTTGIYVAGSAGEAVPGPRFSGVDGFVQKYDDAGNELWTRRFGTPATDVAGGISVGATGVYVVGQTDGILFGQQGAGGSDAFVRKYDALGNERWTRQFGTPDDDWAFGVTTDATGVYVAGSTSGVFPGQSRDGESDAFLRKYDPAGNVLWTREFGGPRLDSAHGVGADSTGVYVAGSVGVIFPVNQTDAFLRKFDRDGNEVWARQFGDLPEDVALDVEAGADGVYVAGNTNQDAFLRRYDRSGAELWAQRFGTDSWDSARGVAVGAGVVYVGGATGGAFPGQASGGDIDAFASAFDPNGTRLWTTQLGTPLSDGGWAVTARNGALYLGGALQGIGTAVLAQIGYPQAPKRVELEFVSETGSITVLWEGEVTSGALTTALTDTGSFRAIAGSGELGPPATAFDVDLRSLNAGRLMTGTLTATRGSQRISVPKMIGLAYFDRVEFPNWATYYDGRNTLFGDLTLRVTASK